MAVISNVASALGPFSCSFCGQDDTAVDIVVATTMAAVKQPICICHECTGLCVDLFNGATQTEETHINEEPI